MTDGTLVTPSVTDSILVGITRDTVLTLASRELRMPVVERRVDRTELYTADECVFLGLAIVATVLFVNVVGERIRDVLDPRLRGL